MSTNPYESPGVENARVKSDFRGVWKWAFRICLLLLGFAFVIALLLPAVRLPRGHWERAGCINNLKQIALALINYESTYGSYPPAYTVDAQGHRLHSWRTLILPHIEQQSLYAKIDLSKAWNDPANRQAYETEVHAYQCLASNLSPGQTTYLAVVAPDGIFQGPTSRALSEVTDDRGATIFVVEVEPGRHVHWMSPEDTNLDWLLNRAKIPDQPHDGLHAVFVDGRASRIDADASEEQLRALVSVAGGDHDLSRGDE